mgnify:CR=1 FL=1
MSKVKSYGLKAYVSNSFDLHVGSKTVVSVLHFIGRYF